MARFYEMGENDSSPVVRLYLASALQRINDFSRFTLASKLVKHAADSSDHNLPKMIWFGIEPLIQVDAARLLEIAVASKIPMITRRSEERRVGKECVSTCRSGWWRLI